MPFDEYGQWVDDQNQAYDPFSRPTSSAAAPPPFQPAPTAPPLYPGQPGSPSTNWQGQPGTVPAPPSGTAGPTSTVDQPMWKDLWAQSGQNPQQFIQAIIGQLGLHGRQTDSTALNTILRALQSVGVNASLDSRTDQYHKGLMINGQFVKLLDGSDRWTYDTSGGSGSGGAAMTIDPSYLSPFTRPVPTYGTPPAFSYGDFQAPTAEEVQNEPGRQFRVDQGIKGIETGASAKGLLNSGGTLADVLGFGQQLASQEYQNVFNRKRDTYALNRSNAADIYRTNYDSQFVDPFARQLQTFDRQKDIWYQNQDAPFNKLARLTEIGANVAPL